MTEKIGQQLGNYRLLRLLGKGGFAEVYLGEHIHLQMQAAIKVLSTQLSDKDVEQFLTEARTIAQMTHPHSIRILDFGIDTASAVPFLVMEYASNGTLRQHYPKGTILPISTIVSYVNQIADVLQYAHDRKIIHRDIKPENMLLGQRDEVLLSDFGIAIAIQSSRSHSKQNVAGTILYMAPEQIQAYPRAASDQYALGIVVYEWLCGQCPFQGSWTEVAVKQCTVHPPSLCEQIPTLSREVEGVVFKALEKDWRSRFASVQDFALALEEATISTFIRPTPSPALPTSPDEQTKRATPPQERKVSSVAGFEKQMSNKEMHEILAKEPPASSTSDQDRDKEISSHASEKVPVPLAFDQGKQNEIQDSQDREGVSEDASLRSSCWTLPRGWYRRRRILVGLAAIAAITASGFVMWPRFHKLDVSKPNNPKRSTPPTIISSSNATMFGSDSQHTHFVSSEHTVSTENVPHLALDWSISTGDAIYSSPTVFGGIVYIGSLDNKLYAFDATKGTLLWSAPTGDKIYSSPSVSGGVVYIGSFDNSLYAFNAITGKPLWSMPTGNAIYSAPAVFEGVVYIGSEDHTLYSFDAVTGKPLWFSRTDGAIHSSPAVSDGIVYIGSDDHKLYAFDAVKGTLLWSVLTGGRIVSSPTIINRRVYVGSYDHKLYAFDAAKGTLLWSTSTDEAIESSPGAANGMIYVGSEDGRLYAFNSITGDRIWVAFTKDAIESSPTIANGVIYISSYDHELYAFDAIKGTSLWSAPTGGKIYSSPIIANGAVYVGSQDHKLYAFHLP